MPVEDELFRMQIGGALVHEKSLFVEHRRTKYVGLCMYKRLSHLWKEQDHISRT